MTDSTSTNANNKKPTTVAFRAGASVVALLLGPLSMGGCMGGGLDDAESVGSVSQAICAANDQTAATTLTVTASSGTEIAAAFDNNVATRWESAHGVDPQWIQVNLGASKFVSRVRIDWEAANAKDYSIRLSNDVNFATYTTLVTKTGMAEGNHRIDDLTGLSGTGRYVRMHGTLRNLTYGYSIYEMDVYGDAAGCDTAAPTGSCFKIKSQRTSNYLFNNAGLVTPGATAATAEVFEKIANGNGFQFKATSNNTLVGISGNDLAVNGGGTVFTEYDCSSAGLYPNGKGYASPTGTGPNWKANSTTTAVNTYNGGNGGSCVNGSATAWERFYLESATCGGGACTPTTCAAQGKNCGSISDGCGGTLSCGTCGAGQTCSASNVCQSSCTPTTCAAQGKNCGSISDGCGGTLACGTCGAGQSCSASNVCQASCTPTTCAAQGKNCGSISDGCGGTLTCGTCGSGQTCSANVCQASGGSCASNDLTTATNMTSSASTASPAGAFDNNVGTRWESTHNVDPQWIQIDLGASKFVNRVRLDWEAANAKDYSVRISDDVNFGTFTTLVTKTGMATGNHRIDDLTGLSGSGRYVRVHGTARNLNYGYSIFEMDVYGDNNASCGGGGGGGCTPTTSCSAQGKTCGTINDGCATVSCGSCGSGQTCNAAQVCQASNEPCGGTCGAGQTCNLSNQCVTEACGGTCAMGQKCVNSACVNDTTAGVGYYNNGVTGPESTPAGFWGSNLKMYRHDSNQTTIATEITTAYTAQRGGNGVTPDGQFSTRRDGFMFAPGVYSAQLDIGFNTQISGLADHPDAVNLSGRIMAMPPANMGNNGTQTFWRFLENFKSTWTATNNIWAVSQAAPMRRVHALGEISLHLDWGWQSGGYISDCVFDGKLHFGSQQQFYTRNSHAATAESGTWNIVVQGVTGTKTQVAFPTGPLTDIPNSPKVREKPFLYVNRDGLYKVFVPAVRTNAVGAAWSATSGGAGTSIPLSKFHVAKEGTDTAATMNSALAAGKHLLITPGIYFLDAPLAVNNANTVVLGIGMATLTPNNGVNAINVADVDGVKIAGILIDAGTGNSDTLLQIGPAGSNADHSANPTSIHDIFTRIGGRGWIAKAKKNIVVNSRNVILDHTWLWRADHGAGVGWTLNTSANGLIVNGSDVISYGTHVEHFQEYQVKWNGENGKNYFFQNELAYESPTQNDYDNPPFASEGNTGVGYASYKVADNVVNHEFIGGGCYAVFTMNDCTSGAQCATGVCEADGKCSAPAGGMEASHCILANPNQAGQKFKSVLSISFTAKGRISNLINNDGNVATASVAFIPKLAAWH